MRVASRDCTHAQFCSNMQQAGICCGGNHDSHKPDTSGGAAPQKQQALLGQMLLEGYGCDRDPAAGREWVDKAKRRGYRMDGVYCEL